MRIALTAIVCASVLLVGCSIPKPRLPRVHKLTVQQGNVITQAMIDKLKPGMTRSQVAFIMGEPVFRNSFNDDRWDYVYTIELPGVYTQNRTVSLFFHEELLAYFTGDMAPTRETGQVQDQQQEQAKDQNESAADAGVAATTGNPISGPKGSD